MGNTIRNPGIVLEKEDEEYVWRFSAILESINSAPNVRELGFIDVVKSPPTTIDISQNLSGAATTLTMHRGFRAVQHPIATNLAPSSAPKEINPAPLIFAGMMLLMTAFHGWGFYQYYRGSVDNRVECKR